MSLQLHCVAGFFEGLFPRLLEGGDAFAVAVGRRPADLRHPAGGLDVAGATQLLEEPLAAFYAWIARHEEHWQDTLRDGDAVLVVDVGGGTTDFSLINVEAERVLRRSAVGDHLLLGGDNMDMTLARRVEAAWKTSLNPRDWSMLCQACRAAKERLLAGGCAGEAR